MLKKIAIVVVVLLAGLLGYAATKPDTYQVSRETTIEAPPERIFSLINDFHQWQAWSPWEKLDADLKRTFSGPESGKGAVYEWSGSSSVGSGRMEVTESTPPTHLTVSLDFKEPMEAHNTVEFTLKPQGESTQVVWSMVGESPYVSKVMTVFFDMDSMVGKDFEAGLANLKAAAEKL